MLHTTFGFLLCLYFGIAQPLLHLHMRDASNRSHRYHRRWLLYFAFLSTANLVQFWMPIRYEFQLVIITALSYDDARGADALYTRYCLPLVRRVETFAYPTLCEGAPPHQDVGTSPRRDDKDDKDD